MLSCILAFLCALLVLAADQYTKYLVSTTFAYGESAELLRGFIDLQYIHNTGGAWGMLSGKTWILLSLTVIVMIILLVYLIKIGRKSKLMVWAVSLVLAGGMGNLIDRVFRQGNVIDFLHFEFYPTFPIFNIADIAVVIGAGLLILYFILDTVKENRSLKNGKT